MNVPEELESLKGFHGHLGPYVTIGFRMGQIARRELGDYRGMKATVYCSLEPPMRCIVDGVQFSSGCTFGKGNIVIKRGANPRAVFTKEDRSLKVALRVDLRKRIDTEMSKAHEAEQSLRYYRMAEGDLLVVSLS